MSLTPLHLNIALHYHVSPAQWRDLTNDTHRRYARDLVSAGLLQVADQDPCGGEWYAKTEALDVFVEALCSTPFPVQKWVMP